MLLLLMLLLLHMMTIKLVIFKNSCIYNCENCIKSLPQLRRELESHGVYEATIFEENEVDHDPRNDSFLVSHHRTLLSERDEQQDRFNSQTNLECFNAYLLFVILRTQQLSAWTNPVFLLQKSYFTKRST